MRRAEREVDSRGALRLRVDRERHPQRSRREVRQREGCAHPPARTGRRAERQGRRRRGDLGGGGGADVDDAGALRGDGVVGERVRAADEERGECIGAERRPRLGEECGGAGNRCSGGTRPVGDGRLPARIDRRERHTGSDDVGLDAAVERQAAGGERRNVIAAGRGRPSTAERDRHGLAVADARDRRAGDAPRHRHNGHAE